MLDEEHAAPERDPDDDNLYILGSIGQHNVVITCLPAGRTNNNPAVAVAMQMRAMFTELRIRLLVGIGGGVPNAKDIRLGDIVVSQPENTFGGVVQYDLGKATPSGVRRTGSLDGPPKVLLSAVSGVKARKRLHKSNLSKHLSELEHIPDFQRATAGPDLLFDADYNHVGGDTCERCNTDRLIHREPRKDEDLVTIHYGTIASGDQLIRSAAERDRISNELGGVLCFEMEAAGLMNNFSCLVIRGICDYADSHKNDKWQPYAAGVAAAYAKELLSIVIPASKVGARVPVHDAIARGVEPARTEKSAQISILESPARKKRVQLDSNIEARGQPAQRPRARARPTETSKQYVTLYKAIRQEWERGEDKWNEIMESRQRNGSCNNCGFHSHWESQCRKTCGKCMTTKSICSIFVLLTTG